MNTKLLSLAIASSMTLTACASDGSNPFSNIGTKQGFGSVLGAVAGGIAGSKVGSGNGQLWATGAGALLGAFVGSEIGKSLDRADMAYHNQATEQAYTAPIGETIAWNNPESGHSGSVTPTREGQTDTGDYCRQYKQSIVIDGQVETAYGTACKQGADWVLVN